MRPLLSINPSNGSIIKSFDQFSEKKIDHIIGGAYKVQKSLGEY